MREDAELVDRLFSHTREGRPCRVHFHDCQHIGGASRGAHRYVRRFLLAHRKITEGRIDDSKVCFR